MADNRKQNQGSGQQGQKAPGRGGDQESRQGQGGQQGGQKGGQGSQQGSQKGGQQGRH